MDEDYSLKWDIVEKIKYIKLIDILNDIKKFDLFLGGRWKFINSDPEKNNLSDEMKFLDTLTSFIQDINTWIKKVNNLIDDIKYSLNEAIKHAQKSNHDFFSPIHITNEERRAFYYIENSIFRIISMWEILAHMYNTTFDLNIPLKRVSYKSFFNKNLAKKLKIREQKKYLVILL